MSKRHSEQLRLRIAQEAARVLASEGGRDYLAAKRKAATRLGIDPQAGMPTNREVEQELILHQRLFEGEGHDQLLSNMRYAAMDAMRMLDQFQPRLTGSVLRGTAASQSDVNLHLFAESAKDVAMFLIEHQIPFESGDKRFRFGKETSYYPVIRLMAGEVPFELAIFPLEGIRQAPLSVVDGRPMQRAGLKQLEEILTDYA
jgi:hypothetical protein